MARTRASLAFCSLRHKRRAVSAWAWLTLVCVGACAPGAPDVGELLRAGRQAMVEGKVEVATACFEQAAQAADSDPQRAQVWLELAGLLERSGNLQAAGEALERLLALPQTPIHPSALERVARLYQRSGQLDRMLGAYERLAALPGQPPEIVQQALQGQVRALQQMGAVERAEQVARAYLERFPQGIYASGMAALVVQVRLDRNDLAAARQAAQAEAAREGGDPTLLLQVAARMQESGNTRGALELAQLYTQLRPEDRDVHEMVLRWHQQAGTVAEYERALVAAAKAGGAAQLRRLADYYQRVEKLEAALATLRRLTEVQPDDVEALGEAARLALKLGRGPEAISLYHRALVLQPGSSRWQVELGDAYATLGDRERALDAWKRAFAYNPRDLTTARLLGRTLDARGLHHDAVQVYLEARTATGDPTALAAELAEAYEGQLLLDRAVAEYLTGLRTGEDQSGWVVRRLQMLAADDVARPELVAVLEQECQRGELPEGALIALGTAYLKNSRPDRAANAFAAIADPVRRSSALLQSAAQAEEGGDWAAARALYQAAMEGAPGAIRAQAALRLAALYLAEEDWPAARDILESVDTADLNPRLADAVRLELADILVLGAGDYQRAAAIYAEVGARSADPASQRRAAWGAADCAFVAGKYSEAATAYRDLMSMEDRSAIPSALGYDDGTGFLTGSPGIEGPARPMGAAYAAYQLAEIEFRSGRFRTATEAFARVAQEYPDSPYANDALERVLLISSEFTGDSPAEEAYVKALRLVDQGALEPAGEALAPIIATGAQEPLADDAAMLWADALRRYGRVTEALDQYRELPRRFPDSFRALEAELKAARLLSRQPEGREEALARYRSVLSRAPDSPEAAEAQMGMDELLRAGTRAASPTGATTAATVQPGGKP